MYVGGRVSSSISTYPILMPSEYAVNLMWR